MANVTFGYNPVPSPACYPPDMNSLAQELTTGGMLVGTIPDTAGGGVTVGSSPPSSALTNKVWFKTDALGRPLGVYMFYNGNWRKVYAGIGIGEIRIWNGVTSGVFDGTNLGVVGGDMDGWVICDSVGSANHGVPNLEDYFLVAGQWGTAADGSGYTGWVTDTDSVFKHTGGAQGTSYNNAQGRLLGINNMPGMHGVAYYAGAQSGGGINVLVPNTTGNKYDIAIGSGTSDTPPGAVPVPFVPFYAVAYVQFVGYA